MCVCVCVCVREIELVFACVYMCMSLSAPLWFSGPVCACFFYVILYVCHLRVLLGCESMGIIILVRVALLAARERSRVDMLLDTSSPSAGQTNRPTISQTASQLDRQTTQHIGVLTTAQTSNTNNPTHRSPDTVYASTDLQHKQPNASES